MVERSWGFVRPTVLSALVESGAVHAGAAPQPPNQPVPQNTHLVAE